MLIWRTFTIHQVTVKGGREKICLKSKYDVGSANPLPWTEHWFNSRSLQNAPQETEIESYVIGGIKQDVEKDQFKKFKL